MSSFKITMPMLEEIWRCGKNPLYNFVPNFVLWAKAEGGCWWWIKDGARKCLKAKIIYYRGSLSRLKKEEYAIMEIPFIEYSVSRNLPIRDYLEFKDLLVDEWLKFINQNEEIRKIINKKYDIVTDPKF